MTQRPRHPAGFTLMEVLTASVIAAVMAASLYVALHVAYRARRSAVEGLETARSARLAVEAIGRDLQSALPPTGILAGQFQGTDARNAAGRDADTVSFYCLADGAQQLEGRGDVQQVSFAFASDPSELTGNTENADGTVGPGPLARRATVSADGSDRDQRVLVRRITRNLLATVAPEPVEQVLCRGVLALSFRYFDGLQWQDTWDSVLFENVAPMAVEVTLDVEQPPDRNGQVTPFRVTRFFRIACGRYLEVDPDSLLTTP